MDTLISAEILIEYPEKETAKFKTVRMAEDFMVDKRRISWYFSRKFSPPQFTLLPLNSAAPPSGETRKGVQTAALALSRRLSIIISNPVLTLQRNIFPPKWLRLQKRKFHRLN